jgi:hypothetical protein
MSELSIRRFVCDQCGSVTELDFDQGDVERGTIPENWFWIWMNARAGDGRTGVKDIKSSDGSPGTAHFCSKECAVKLLDSFSKRL